MWFYMAIIFAALTWVGIELNEVGASVFSILLFALCLVEESKEDE
jgi:hypothetical protein